VRNFAIPTHERNRKNPLGVNSKTVMEAREHFCGYHPRGLKYNHPEGEAGKVGEGEGSAEEGSVVSHYAGKM
jgi:hypothetical protein